MFLTYLINICFLIWLYKLWVLAYSDAFFLLIFHVWCEKQNNLQGCSSCSNIVSCTSGTSYIIKKNINDRPFIKAQVQAQFCLTLTVGLPPPCKGKMLVFLQENRKQWCDPLSSDSHSPPLWQWYIPDLCRTAGQKCTPFLDRLSRGVHKWLILPFGNPSAATVLHSWLRQNCRSETFPRPLAKSCKADGWRSLVSMGSPRTGMFSAPLNEHLTVVVREQPHYKS